MVTRHAFRCSFYVRFRFVYEPTADRWLWFMVCYIHVAIFLFKWNLSECPPFFLVFVFSPLEYFEYFELEN